jgi:hypothetical protein
MTATVHHIRLGHCSIKMMLTLKHNGRITDVQRLLRDEIVVFDLRDRGSITHSGRGA